ncbi:MAG: hypothetical protein WBP29_11775 [Candidatus Zixiibacteriota bacterium]
MSRIQQLEKTKGSQHWLQMLVNSRPHILIDQLRKPLGLTGDDSIIWRSPLAHDNYSEYSDDEFLKKLDLEGKLQHRPLESFWPHRGPVWDGLATTNRGDVILVEAKAHVNELVSPACGASEPAMTLIRKSLNETREFLGVTTGTDWAGTYYQYTNRLAHLYLLRVRNNIPAWLVFVYFLNAQDVKGPTTIQEWKNKIGLMHDQLGLGKHPLEKFVVEVMVEAGK